jgi:hypothetical protein
MVSYCSIADADEIDNDCIVAMLDFLVEKRTLSMCLDSLCTGITALLQQDRLSSVNTDSYTTYTQVKPYV